MVHKRIETLPTAIRNNQGWIYLRASRLLPLSITVNCPYWKWLYQMLSLELAIWKTAVLDAIAVDIMVNILDQSERQVRSTLGMYNKTDDASGKRFENCLPTLANCEAEFTRSALTQWRKSRSKKAWWGLWSSLKHNGASLCGYQQLHDFWFDEPFLRRDDGCRILYFPGNGEAVRAVFNGVATISGSTMMGGAMQAAALLDSWSLLLLQSSNWIWRITSVICLSCYFVGWVWYS